MKWVIMSLLTVLGMSALSGCKESPPKALHFSTGPFADNEEVEKNQ